MATWRQQSARLSRSFRLKETGSRWRPSTSCCRPAGDKKVVLGSPVAKVRASNNEVALR